MAGPAISDSRPEAARRISSIWNIRSRACTKPSAAAASVALAARMRGMPSASKPISTGPDRPGMRACCDRGGRVSHSTPVTTAATNSTMNTDSRQQAAEDPEESAHGAKVGKRRAEEKAHLDDTSVPRVGDANAAMLAFWFQVQADAIRGRP